MSTETEILTAALDKLIAVAKEQNGVPHDMFATTMEAAFVAAGKRTAIENGDILVVRLDDIGDNVLMSGFLRELRRNFRDKRITLVVCDAVYNLVEKCPYVNEVYSVRQNLDHPYFEWLENIKKLFVRVLWNKEISLCLMPRWDLDIQGSVMLGYLSGARERISYSESTWAAKTNQNKNFDAFLTKVIFDSPFAIHEMDRNFLFLEELGLPVVERGLELWTEENDRQYAIDLLNKNNAYGKILIAVTTGGSSRRKVYPKEKFLAALQRIVEPGKMLVFLGSAKDGNDAAWITERLPSGCSCNLCGQTTIRQAAEVIGFCTVYIGGDTSLKHLAAAKKKPVVEISSESRSLRFLLSSLVRRFKAWQVPSVTLQPLSPLEECRMFTHCHADEPHCITQIDPQEIVAAYNAVSSGQVKDETDERWQPDFGEIIRPNAREILELGAKDSQAARAFFSVNPDAHYIAVAADEAAALAATANTAAKPAVAPFASFNPALIGDKKFDCIIIRDEWLSGLSETHTARKLQQIAKTLLAPDGQLLYYFMNPSHFRVALYKLRGRPTSVANARSLPEVKAMLRNAGLAIDCMLPSVSKDDEEYANFPYLQNLFADMKNIADMEMTGKFAPDKVRAYVIRAALKLPPRMKIFSIIGEKITARVRLNEPNGFAGRHLAVINSEKSMEGPVNLDSDRAFAQKVFIRQRITSFDAVQTAKEDEKIFAAGYLLMGEIDDHPDIWRESYENSRYIDFISPHAMQVSTAPLADVIKNFNPHVYVFENQLKNLPAPRNWTRERRKPLTLMFAALNRQNDWRPIMPAINEVLRKNPQVMVQVLFDAEFFNALETNNKRFIGTGYYKNFVPYEEYCRALHTADINLLPLSDTAINRVKSDLKFIESAGNGAAVLASPVVYERYVDDGKTGLICRDAKDFAQNLTRLIEEPKFRRQIADNAYQYVKRNRLLSAHYTERLEVYRELIARLPSLTAEARQRIAVALA